MAKKKKVVGVRNEGVTVFLGNREFVFLSDTFFIKALIFFLYLGTVVLLMLSLIQVGDNMLNDLPAHVEYDIDEMREWEAAAAKSRRVVQIKKAIVFMFVVFYCWASSGSF